MTDSLAEALALLQKDLPRIEKVHTATVRSEKGVYSYDYADLTDVSDEILPRLSGLGLSWMCMPTLNEAGRFVLRYELLHTSGQSRTGEYPIAAKDNSTAQTIGGLITYARRYALCAVTGVAPKGDDNDAADQPKTRTAQRQNRPAAHTQGATPAPQKTAQRAKVDGPPLPGDDGPQLLSSKQRGMMLALFEKAGIEDRDERLDITRRIIGRLDLDTANKLTTAEASQVIDQLQEAEKHPNGFSGYLAELAATEETL
jgi:hypothetical protein